MLMSYNRIGSVAFDSTPTDESIIDGAMVPIMNLQNPRDFDYDSEKGEVYWVEYTEDNKTVRKTKSLQLTGNIICMNLTLKLKQTNGKQIAFS